MRILTHTSTFPCKATGLDRDEERKDRALVDVGGCLVLSFLRFTFSTAHLLIQCRPVFSGLYLWLAYDLQIPIVIKNKNQCRSGENRKEQLCSGAKRTFFSFLLFPLLSSSPSFSVFFCHPFSLLPSLSS